MAKTNIIQVNGVEYGVPASGVDYPENFAVAVPSGRESYGPVIQWRLAKPTNGKTYFAALLPPGFVGRCAVVNRPGNSFATAASGAGYVGITKYRTYVSGDSGIVSGSGVLLSAASGGLAGEDYKCVTLMPTVSGTVTGFEVTAPNDGKDTFLAVTISGMSGDAPVDLCVFGDVPHPLLANFLG